MGNYTVKKDIENGVIEYNFDRYSVDASFHLEQTDTLQNHFTFYGMSLENDNPGVTYHALGINGARIPSWIRCSYFSRQLKALNPDWVVIYLGVNDGNTTHFSQDSYYSQYVSLLDDIRMHNPKVQFTLIVPNDYFLLRRHPNPNVELEQKAIMQLVNKYNCSMYSIYDVMGGYGSCVTWLKHGLMASDKVHFSVAGYTYTGNLFFNAFLRTYDNYLEKK
jgi:lysophospholipase L1-like esterase